MYGQTNCWILPEGEYGAFEIKEGEVAICSQRAAYNMAFQEHSLEYGKEKALIPSIKGQDLIGIGLAPPFGTKYDTIYTLPMLTVLMDKGTGVVTSVPSDSPADWRTMQDLKEKKELREKFGVKDEWVLPYDVIEIIDIEGLGKRCAETVCQEMKIASQNDPLLEEAKATCYTRGFTKGVMLVGKYAGEKVSDVKPKIAKQLIEEGLAFKFADPSDRVVSRSGDECVVCLSDQWYLPYGEGEWLEKAQEAVKKMRMYGDEKATRKSFKEALEWLHEWAFSRTYGLGTKVPWDENFLIESLSDSTIYMAYYTFAHLLQGDGLVGEKGGPLGIKPEQMTDGAWDYVFALSEKGKAIEGCDIPLESLDKMRHEFEFWYPYDVRVSGKDLIKNHLTFAMYNHTAIFPEQRWPAGVRTNGFLLLNGKKMSKSLGNFLTLRESIEKYSADATRMALAEAGDNLDNSNFTHGAANASILRLNKLMDFAQEMKEKKGSFREGEKNFRDRVFSAQLDRAIHRCTAAFEEMNFREALISGVFDLKTDIDTYINSVASLGGLHGELIFRYLEVQILLLDPISPHVSQHIWESVLERDGFACDAPWPKAQLSVAEAEEVIAEDKWAQGVLYEVRSKVNLEIKNASKKGGKFVCEKVLLVFGKQAEYVVEAEKILKARYNPETKSLPPFKDLSADVKKIECLKGDRKALPMCMKMVKEAAATVEKEGESGLQLGLSFEGKNVLQENERYLAVSLGLTGSVEFKEEEEVKEKLPHKRILSVKGRPVTATIYLTSVE
uniref:leucine--tRNA ligase n=1 Tax=Paramoeba aestuarina TaxID=180227 RepID=A0A7S4KN36_9EUKA